MCCRIHGKLNTGDRSGGGVQLCGSRWQEKTLHIDHWRRPRSDDAIDHGLWKNRKDKKKIYLYQAIGEGPMNVWKRYDGQIRRR